MSCGKYYESTETLHTLCQNLKSEICLQKCENVTPVACYFIDSYTLPRLDLERRLKYEAAENTPREAFEIEISRNI